MLARQHKAFPSLSHQEMIGPHDSKACSMYIEERLYLDLQGIYTAAPDEYEMSVKTPSSQVEPYRTPNR